MINRPLFIPAGVRLVPLGRGEEAAAVDRVVLVCEGACRPQWTAHRRSSSPFSRDVDDTSSPLAQNLAANSAAMVRANMAASSSANAARFYTCEGCGKTRRFGL